MEEIDGIINDKGILLKLDETYAMQRKLLIESTCLKETLTQNPILYSKKLFWRHFNMLTGMDSNLVLASLGTKMDICISFISSKKPGTVKYPCKIGNFFSHVCTFMNEDMENMYLDRTVSNK